MTLRSTIEIRPELGYVALGARRLTLTLEEHGVLRVNGSARLRPASVDDRERLVRDALVADDPAAALVARLAEHAILDRGDLDDDVLRLLAVALAGGEETDRSFPDAARLAAEREGWSWGQLRKLPAWVVDRAAKTACEGDDGWSTIVFEPDDTDAMTCALDLARTLLRRSIDCGDPPHPCRSATASHAVGAEDVSALPARSARVPGAVGVTNERPGASWSEPSADHTPPVTENARLAATAWPRHGSPPFAVMRQRDDAAPTARVRRLGAPAASARTAVATDTAAPRSTGAIASSPTPGLKPRGHEKETVKETVAATSTPMGSHVAAQATAPETTLAAYDWGVAARQAESVAPAHTPAALPEPWNVFDLIDDVARALDAECDLRGLDR